MSNEPKILLLDIETMANLGYFWGLFQEITNTNMLVKDWYVLCVCCKWLGENKVMSFALPDFPAEYKKNPENDKMVLKSIWKLLDEADVVIGQNSNRFDLLKLNTRFIQNGMTPPSPYQKIDTYQVAKNNFGFTSNKLDDLGRYLGVGRKKQTGGFELWKKCADGDLKAWKKMVNYCKGDVLLLEKIYLKMRPYINNHPNLAIYVHDDICPKCQSKNLQKQGVKILATGVYQKFVCKDCGSWVRGYENLKKGKKVLKNA